MCSLVPRIEDEAVGIHDSGGSKVLTIGPENRTAGRARGTQNALGGVIEASAFLWGLQAFLVRLGRGNQEGLHLAVRLEKGLHIDDEVFF